MLVFFLRDGAVTELSGDPRRVFRGVGGAQRQRAMAAAGSLGPLLEGAQLPYPRRAGDFRHQLWYCCAAVQ